MKGNALLYLVEGGAPALVALLARAAFFALKKDIARHKKAAIIHVAATWISLIVVAVLVNMGYAIGENAPAWILNIHLAIIYLIPPLLVILPATALTGRRTAHMMAAITYCMVWAATLITGAMIFSMSKGWL
ncbi:MAG: hypothetical protein HQK86_08735 [Nitrospinae bacterium]|nr:hypothetical protein [Nitrospinota bacterium]